MVGIPGSVGTMQELADRVGMELPKQEMTSAQRREADRRTQLLEINKEAAKYFYMLLRGPRGQRAHEYFKKRELSDETMQKFGLGYSDQYSDDLYKYLRSKGYDDEVQKSLMPEKFNGEGIIDVLGRQRSTTKLEAAIRLLGEDAFWSTEAQVKTMYQAVRNMTRISKLQAAGYKPPSLLLKIRVNL